MSETKLKPLYIRAPQIVASALLIIGLAASGTIGDALVEVFLQRHCNHLERFTRTFEPADDKGTLQRGEQKQRQRLRVRTWLDFPLANPTFNGFSETVQKGARGLASALPQGRVAVIIIDGGVHHGASTWDG